MCNDEDIGLEQPSPLKVVDSITTADSFPLSVIVNGCRIYPPGWVYMKALEDNKWPNA